MDEFEAALVEAFRTPTDRSGRWAVAAAVEQEIRRRAAMRRMALTAATLLGVGIAAALMTFAGALGPIDQLAQEAAMQAQAIALKPLALALVGFCLLTVAVGGVAARDL